MTGYLQDGETYESRLLDLMIEVRRAPQDELRTRRFQEVMALTAVMQATGLGAPSSPTVNVFHGDERGLDPQDDIDQETVDYLVGVLDASYGGEAPATIRSNFLYHLTGQGAEVEVTGAEFQVQADDPDDKLGWTKLDVVDFIEDKGETIGIATGNESPTAHEMAQRTFDMMTASEDDEPEPISAAERLRQKTKKKGKQ